MVDKKMVDKKIDADDVILTESEVSDLVELTLLADYWDENEKRIYAGSVIDLPFETAEKLVDEGKAKVPLQRKK